MISWNDVLCRFAFNSIHLNDFVFFDALPFTGAEEVVVLTEDEWLPEEDVPRRARERGMLQQLSIRQIEDVLSNARRQGLFDLQEQYMALRYFYENDSFIDLTTR